MWFDRSGAIPFYRIGTVLFHVEHTSQYGRHDFRSRNVCLAALSLTGFVPRGTLPTDLGSRSYLMILLAIGLIALSEVPLYRIVNMPIFAVCFLNTML
jgi:hypothetical protein